MKLFFATLLSFLPFFSLFSAPVLVTFSVDMKHQDNFEGVGIQGGVTNWGDLVVLTNEPGTTIYKGTITLDTDENNYSYRFVKLNIDNSFKTWEENIPSECTFDWSDGHRIIYPPTQDTILPTVCYAACAACQDEPGDAKEPVKVTFQVDAQNLGDISGLGLNGSINDWSGTIEMEQISGSTIYQATVELDPEVTGYTYRYTILDAQKQSLYWEDVPDDCRLENDDNRWLPTPAEDTVLTAICYGECAECEPADTEEGDFIQLQVNMKYFPEFKYPAVTGGFNDWGTPIPLNQVGTSSIYSAKVPYADNNNGYAYRFVALNESGEIIYWETVPTDCALTGDENRWFPLPATDTEVAPVCFSWCRDSQVDDQVFEVDVLAHDNGEVLGVGHYFENQQANLNALPEEGYVFKGWQVNGETVSNDNPYQFNVMKDLQLSALFAPLAEENLKITFSVDVANLEQVYAVGLTGGIIDWGTPIEMTQQADAGSVYETTVSLPLAEANNIYTYRFVTLSQANTVALWEDVPLECRFENDENRFFETPAVDLVLPTVCFSSCDECKEYILNTSSELQVKVYPNPVNELLRIIPFHHHQGMAISIYDLQGKRLLEDEFKASEYLLNVGSLPAGIYLLELRQNDKYKVQQFIKY
ncbi:T9SS type A sorting domain-containing protein [Persicobacter diffluens]|uniref:CBM20 domain-containing protein n=1 Tax=Persicobacter diffluens TaxID=981 RepID=A0AAN4W5D4_9BACT|nr:hypothetical protein PEDI_49520 [Persicobacter diffluens]